LLVSSQLKKNNNIIAEIKKASPSAGVIIKDYIPENIVIKNWPEKFSDILNEIGVSSRPNDIGEGEVEKGDYYSRCFSQTTRMVTNKGSLKVSGKNIDTVQIIQKG